MTNLTRVSVRDQLLEWVNFLGRVFDCRVGVSGLNVPRYQSSFSRTVVVPNGLTLNQFFQSGNAYLKRRSHIPYLYKYYGDLNEWIPQNDRSTKNTYVIRVRNQDGPDPEFDNNRLVIPEAKFEEELKKKRIKGITLLEQLLLELKRIDEGRPTYRHSNHVMTCMGSRDKDGQHPGIVLDSTHISISNAGLVRPLCSSLGARSVIA